jgi:hypothetical protein
MMNPLVQSDTGLALWALLYPIAVILVIVRIVIFFRRSRGGFVVPDRSRRPGRRRLIARIICGVIGAMILVALGIGAMWDARGAITLLHLPTKPPPDLPKPRKNEALPIEKARLLFHFIFIRNNIPIYAEEMEVRLPEDGGRNFSKAGSFSAVRFEIKLALSTLIVTRFAGSSSDLSSNAQYHLQLRDSLRSSSASGGVNLNIPKMGDGSSVAARTEILGTMLGDAMVQVICLARLVALDDPLKAASFSELVQGLTGFVNLAAPPITRTQDLGMSNPAGIRLAKNMGFSFGWLMVAALFLSQCFARRGMALAGILALCILYVAALDRAALAAHVSKLENKDLTVETRALAAESLFDTFFYRNSAMKAADRAAKDATNPESLRKLLRSAGEIWFNP